jgi:hypothetical protein
VIALPEEHAIRPQSRLDESCVFDKHTLKSNDLFERERGLASLQDSAAPSLQASARRPFALDLEAGAAVGQQEKAGRACDEVRAGPADSVTGLCCQVRGYELAQRLRSSNDRTEPACSQKVVANTVSLRQTGFSCEVGFRFQKIDSRHVRRIFNVQLSASLFFGPILSSQTQSLE